MKEVLESRGWVMIYECLSCGRKQHFINNAKPGFEIKTKVQSNNFTIYQNNKAVAGPFPAYQLEQKLTQYVP